MLKPSRGGEGASSQRRETRRRRTTIVHSLRRLARGIYASVLSKYAPEQQLDVVDDLYSNFALAGEGEEGEAHFYQLQPLYPQSQTRPANKASS